MRIRTLVPAIACLAAVPAFVAAADTVPVKFNGFVDTIYGWSDNKSDEPSDPTATSVNSGFQYFAKLGADITISDKVAGKIDLTNAGNAYTGENGVYIRQAYGTWAITPETTFKSGRFITALGWTAAYAPSMWRVGTGPITSLYGVDSAVGADVTYAKGDLTLEATVANGVFAEGEGASSQGDQGNYAYGYIFDAAYALPDKKGTIDVELAYDANANGKKGNGTHLGANATLTPTDELSLGFEAIYQKLKAADGTGGADQKNLGLLATANYKIPKAAWNANVTGSLEYVKKTNIAQVDGDDSKATEVAVALLTNPAGTDKFGVNAEIAYTKTVYDASSTEDKAFSISLEALYVIP